MVITKVTPIEDIQIKREEIKASLQKYQWNTKENSKREKEEENNYKIECS